VRLPVRKIHRAFPELDIFSDEECERYLLQVRSQQRVLGISFAATGAMFVLWLFLLIPIGLGLLSLARVGDGSQYAGTLVLFLLGGIVVCMTFLLMRDYTLIRGVRNRVRNARCTNCRHSLLGLPPLPAEEDSVRCPECGSVIVLHEIGLKPDDLRPRAAPDAPAALL
jgi:DNA-directed RNA polymerase subunit RPC12/RpoP